MVQIRQELDLTSNCSLRVIRLSGVTVVAIVTAIVLIVLFI